MRTIALLMFKVPNIFGAVPLKLNIIRQECCNLSNTNLQFMERLQIFWFIEENYNSMKLLFAQCGLHKQELRDILSLFFLSSHYWLYSIDYTVNQCSARAVNNMQFLTMWNFPHVYLWRKHGFWFVSLVPSPNSSTKILFTSLSLKGSESFLLKFQNINPKFLLKY